MNSSHVHFCWQDLRLKYLKLKTYFTKQHLILHLGNIFSWLVCFLFMLFEPPPSRVLPLWCSLSWPHNLTWRYILDGDSGLGNLKCLKSDIKSKWTEPNVGNCSMRIKNNIEHAFVVNKTTMPWRSKNSLRVLFSWNIYSRYTCSIA